MVTLYEIMLWPRYGYLMAMLWLLRITCLHFLWLLEYSSSLLAQALPILG